MRTSITSLLTVAMMIFTSCSQIQVWDPDERSASGRVYKQTIEKLIPVPLDPKQPLGHEFALYYFIRVPETGRAKKNVLFCTGGPGLTLPGGSIFPDNTFVDFLRANGYNLVFFHPRGAGFSQIPASNRYDQYLKTAYVVADIEAIRQDLLGKDGKWDAIIGWSYGTVVAQQYAHSHGDNLDRLILIGPESRHMFNNSPTAFADLVEAIRATNRETLESIFYRDEYKENFEYLSDDKKKTIIDGAFGSTKMPGIFDRVEKAFGSLQFVIDSYCELKAQKKLAEFDLDYKRDFFEALRGLRMVGSKSENGWDEKRIEYGKAIADAFYPRESIVTTPNDCSRPQSEERGDSSKRVYYAVHAYDGINARFLNEWQRNGKRHVRDALLKSGGEARANEYIEKVGISDSATIRPWDPAGYKHNKPTLIIKGSADTVSAGGQAEHFYENALTGPRTLVEFPRVGHLFALPDTEFSTPPVLSGAVRIDPPQIPPKKMGLAGGTFKGRKLDQNFRLELTPLEELEKGLKLAGFGLIKKENTRDTDNQTLNVVALIENTGDQPVHGTRRKWTVSSEVFSGTVYLNPELVKPGETKRTYGTIEDGRRNEEHAIQLKKPEDLEESLEPICYAMMESVLTIWLKNKNDSGPPVEAKKRRWKLSKDNIVREFELEPVSIPPQKVKDRSVAILDLKNEATTLIAPPGMDRNLRSCLPPQDTGAGTLHILILNINHNVIPAVEKPWKITNPLFDITFDIEPGDVPALGAVKRVAKNVEFRWKKPPRLITPAKLELGLEHLGFNVTGENSVSVVLGNNSENSINGLPRDWIYVDPNEDKKSACFAETTPLDCLIYSFIVLDSAAFSEAQDNEILRIVRDCYAAKISTFGLENSPRHSLANCP